MSSTDYREIFGMAADAHRSLVETTARIAYVAGETGFTSGSPVVDTELFIDWAWEYEHHCPDGGAEGLNRFIETKLKEQKGQK